jgi:hypothetical protein
VSFCEVDCEKFLQLDHLDGGEKKVMQLLESKWIAQNLQI